MNRLQITVLSAADVGSQKCVKVFHELHCVLALALIGDQVLSLDSEKFWRPWPWSVMSLALALALDSSPCQQHYM